LRIGVAVKIKQSCTQKADAGDCFKQFHGERSFGCYFVYLAQVH
jgi:hypothetical protein